MRVWPFKKRPTSPPFEVNRNFYLSVLSPSEQLPTLLSIVNPDGSNGALKGFGVPMKEGASRDLLNKPLERGQYAISTKDKLTVVQADVFPISEVRGFTLPDSEAARENSGLVGEKLAIAQSARTLINLTIRGYSPEVYPSIRFYLDIASRIGLLTDSIVADPLAEVYRSPTEFTVIDPLDDRIDFRNIGSWKLSRLEDGIWVSTRGMVKFNLPEYEMFGLPDDLAETSVRMLVAAGQQALIGMPMNPGESAFSVQSPLQVRQGMRKRELWGDRPTLEFYDDGSDSAADGVRAWAEAGN